MLVLKPTTGFINLLGRTTSRRCLPHIPCQQPSMRRLILSISMPMVTKISITISVPKLLQTTRSPGQSIIACSKSQWLGLQMIILSSQRPKANCHISTTGSADIQDAHKIGLLGIYIYAQQGLTWGLLIFLHFRILLPGSKVVGVCSQKRKTFHVSYIPP